jgi:hypothetical protein
VPVGRPAEETDDPTYADERNFFKVERWTRNDLHVEAMLHAGSSIETARAVFNKITMQRPRGRYTIRQRTHVLAKWPRV